MPCQAVYMPSAYTKLLIQNYQKQELLQSVTEAQLHSVQRKLERNYTIPCLFVREEKNSCSSFPS